MEYRLHGGHCCGYGHVCGFDSASEANLLEAIQEHDNAARGRNRVLEAILTDRQLSPDRNDWRVLPSIRDEGGWPVILARHGFRLAAQWQNSNTGRRCYQFLKIPTLLTDDEVYQPSFPWAGGILPRPAVPPAPPPREMFRVVTEEYYASLQRLGRRGPFNSEEEAREAYPRCRRFERRSILNDGSSLWSDGDD